MVTLDIHFSSWNGVPFYIVLYGFYVYYFSVSKIKSDYKRNRHFQFRI